MAILKWMMSDNAGNLGRFITGVSFLYIALLLRHHIKELIRWK